MRALSLLSEFLYSSVITVNDVSKCFILFFFFQLGSHLLYIMNAMVH